MYQGTITQLFKTYAKQMTFIMPNRQTGTEIIISTYSFNKKENHIIQFPISDSPRIFLTSQINPTKKSLIPIQNDKIPSKMLSHKD